MLPLTQVSLIFACGTALISDGYVNGVIGTVVTILQRKFGPGVVTTNEHTTLNSIGFAGTIVGMLTFGYVTDKFGRKFGMMMATGIMILFSFLSACAQGAHNSTHGLLVVLIVFRFFLGIGIGAEYPCGGVAASEQSEEGQIAKHSQNRWYCLATNTTVNFGFVIGAFVPLVLWWIFGDKHLDTVWRGSLGFGILPAFIVFLWRLRMTEPKRYKEDGMRYASIPYGLVIRRYWPGLAAISLTWFLFDFVSYPFGLFGSTILNSVSPEGASFGTVLGWNVVINLFNLPGTILGAFAADYIGPKRTLCWGLGIQAVFGFVLAGTYPMLKNHVAGFAIMYGIFLSFGVFSSGSGTVIFAAKTGPTAVRGHYYGTAAAIGKVGALIGTQAFPRIVNAFGGSTSNRGNSGPFFIGSAVVFLSFMNAVFFIRPLSENGMVEVDKSFREYLIRHGYDVSKMGLPEEESDSVSSDRQSKEKVDVV